MSKQSKSIIPNRHNFEVLLEQAHEAGDLHANHFYLINVFHDDDCSIYKDSFCDCDCLIRVEDITAMTSSYVN